MMTRFMQLVQSAKCVVLSALAATALGSTAFGDTVLTQDEDWRGQEATMLKGKIDLNGHKLTVSTLTGNAEITDTAGCPDLAYERLEYIESTSAGKQWLDTGYKHKKGDRVICDVELNASQPNANACLFGTYGYNQRFILFVNKAGTSIYSWLASGKTGPSKNVTAGTVLGKRGVFNFYNTINSKSGFTWTPQDGSPVVSAESADVNTGDAKNTMPIFVLRNSNATDDTTTANTGYCAVGKIYSFKIVSSDGTVQRDYIPVQRKSNKKPGLYDVANGVFYENKGSGADFTAGPVLPWGADLTEPGGKITLKKKDGTAFSTTPYFRDGTTEEKLIDNLPDGGDHRLLIGDAPGTDAAFKGCRINYDFGDGKAKVVQGLRLRTGNNAEGRKPKDVTVYGAQKDPEEATDSDWTKIATIDGKNIKHNDWSSQMFSNETAYRAYRLDISDNWEAETNYDLLELWELELVSPPGELHLNVASGQTVVNTTVALTGSLKLVKEGEGTYTPKKYYQTYAGGNEIAAGTIKLYNDTNADSTTYAMAQSGGKKPLGIEGRTVVVKPGATLDLSGVYDTKLLRYELAGGTVVNSKHQKQKTYGSFGNAVLTADSFFSDWPSSSGYETVFSEPIDLGGKKLTVDLGYRLHLAGTFANGTLVLQGPGGTAGGGWFQVDGAAKQMTDVDIDMKGCALSLQQNISVRDLTVSTSYASSTKEGDGHLYIGGTYTPVTDYIHNFVMQDGSTLNLGAKTGAWNCGKLAFANNATITIDVGARELHKDNQVVAWSAKPANAEGLTFRIVGTKILKDDFAQITDAGIFYTADPDAIMTATWTGEAGDGKLDNHANWACTNAVGGGVSGELPGEKTTVTFAGGNLPNITAGSTFTAAKVVLSGASLTENCDWSGVTAPVSGKIDLKGNNLTVSQLPSTWDVEITDSNGANYQLLDSITSTGLQYINTRYKPLANDRMIADLNYIGHSGGSAGWPFGVTPGGESAFQSAAYGGSIYLFKSGSDARTYYYGHGRKQFPTPMPFGTRVTIDCNGGNATWTSGSGSSSATGLNRGSASLSPMLIFNSNSSTGDGVSLTGYNAKMTLYSFTIKSSDGTVQRQFVPAKCLADDKVGLLDLVHEEFYPDAADGNFTAGSVTNAMFHAGAPGGELHVNVAQGKTVENTTVALTGSLKLVKEGEGTFVSMDATQTYVGGTDVLGGTVKFGGSSYLGADNAPITVCEGAVLDVGAGNNRKRTLPVLAGGTLCNSEADVDSSKTQHPVIVLTDNSSINFTKDGGMIGAGNTPTTLDLGGNELDLKVASGKSFWFDNVDVSAGTLKLSGGGTLAVDMTGLRAAAADFDIASKVTVAVPAEVHDWIVREGATVSGSGTISVNGTFRPTVDTEAKYELKNGATLDLSDKTGAWNCGTLAFADNATITIDLGKREDTGDHGKIVSWATAPTNLGTLTFRLAEGISGRLEVTSEGIFLRRAFMMFIK